jgi:hypothetical protein
MQYSIITTFLAFLGVTLAGFCQMPDPELGGLTLVALFRENFTDIEPKPEHHVYERDLHVCKPPPVGVKCMDITKNYRCTFYS